MRGTVGNWWWKPQSVEEYAQVISPYNTYLNAGLPPGPIANPGLSAIDATRSPAATNYCFFLGTGKMVAMFLRRRWPNMSRICGCMGISN
ncbi:MAG: endolytic transglycosylase MltG [Caldilineaceae bacterium]